MMRIILALVVAAAALPASAQSEKEETCRLQAEVVVAVQQARLDRVRERRVQQKILDGNPTWPENYNNMIPVITPWVYEMPMKQVRENNLGEVWNAACLSQP